MSPSASTAACTSSAVIGLSTSAVLSLDSATVMPTLFVSAVACATEIPSAFSVRAMTSAASSAVAKRPRILPVMNALYGSARIGHGSVKSLLANSCSRYTPEAGGVRSLPGDFCPGERSSVRPSAFAAAIASAAVIEPSGTGGAGTAVVGVSTCGRAGGGGVARGSASAAASAAACSTAAFAFAAAFSFAAAAFAARCGQVAFSWSAWSCSESVVSCARGTHVGARPFFHFTLYSSICHASRRCATTFSIPDVSSEAAAAGGGGSARTALTSTGCGGSETALASAGCGGDVGPDAASSTSMATGATSATTVSADVAPFKSEVRSRNSEMASASAGVLRGSTSIASPWLAVWVEGLSAQLIAREFVVSAISLAARRACGPSDPAVGAHTYFHITRTPRRRRRTTAAPARRAPAASAPRPRPASGRSAARCGFMFVIVRK